MSVAPRPARLRGTMAVEAQAAGGATDIHPKLSTPKNPPGLEGYAASSDSALLYAAWPCESTAPPEIFFHNLQPRAQLDWRRWPPRPFSPAKPAAMHPLSG